MRRLFQPGDGAAGAGSRDPQLAEHIVGRRPCRVAKVVVVALRHEVPTPDRDDPMQDARARLVVLVEHDVADGVRVARPHEHEVAPLEVRLHRAPVHDGVGRRAPQLHGPEEPPAAREQRDRDDDADEAAGRAGHRKSCRWARDAGDRARDPRPPFFAASRPLPLPG